jgi:hypothetical protein
LKLQRVVFVENFDFALLKGKGKSRKSRFTSESRIRAKRETRKNGESITAPSASALFRRRKLLPAKLPPASANDTVGVILPVA